MFQSQPLCRTHIFVSSLLPKYGVSEGVPEQATTLVYGTAVSFNVTSISTNRVITGADTVLI